MVPAGLSNVVALDGGGGHCGYTLALTADGQLTAWGKFYQRGIVPAFVPDGLTNVVAVAADDNHNLALTAAGTVIEWGSTKASLTNIPPGLTNVVAVSVGDDHDLVLKAEGTVAVWGDNPYGQLNVPPEATNVVAIASGRWHCLALRADGTLVAWGQYFDGTYYQPMTAPKGLSNVVAIAAGGWISVALVGTGAPGTAWRVSGPRLSSSTGFLCALPTQSGRIYRPEYKDDVADPNWAALPLIAGNGDEVLIRDAWPTNSQRFYRVRRW